MSSQYQHSTSQASGAPRYAARTRSPDRNIIGPAPCDGLRPDQVLDAAMSLPVDVWYIICNHVNDTSTLFSLATTAKFMDMALPRLYDVHRTESSGRPWAEESKHRLIRWAQFWRTIVLSTLNTDSNSRTSHHYVRYLRVFDVLDLEWLLESIVSDERAKDIFFTDEILSLLQLDSKRYKLRDVPRIINSIANILLPHCSAVEEISREPTDHVLTTRVENFVSWLQQLPRLQILRVFDGTSLTRPVRQVLRERCPKLTHFDIYLFMDVSDVDSHVCTFLEEVPRNWESCIIRNCMIGNQTLAALARASRSLRHLELWSHKVDKVLDWGLLSQCTSLETLALIDFDMPFHMSEHWFGPFDEFFDGPFKLRSLHMEGVSYCLAFSTKLLLADSNLRVLRLRLDKDDDRVVLPRSTDWAMRTIEDFNSGLSKQSHLTDLDLIIMIPEAVAVAFASHLIEALSHLQSLKNLQLGSSAGPTGFVTDEHIVRISKTLSLDSFKVASYTLTNRSLVALENMRCLRTFESMLPCHATGEGLLRLVKRCKTLEVLLFIGSLDPPIVETIEEILSSRGGRFTNFTPYIPRHDYASGSDSNDDDFEP